MDFGTGPSATHADEHFRCGRRRCRGAATSGRQVSSIEHGAKPERELTRNRHLAQTRATHGGFVHVPCRK